MPNNTLVLTKFHGQFSPTTILFVPEYTYNEYWLMTQLNSKEFEELHGSESERSAD